MTEYIAQMDGVADRSFFDWLGEPRQIIAFSLLFITLTVIITKLCKRRRHGGQDLRVRDPRKGHRWIPSDFIIKPTYCNICKASLVRGVFCDTCSSCVHDECENEANKLFACKVMSLSERPSMRHHWVEGNLPLCSTCTTCSSPCGVEPRLCDFRCIWCQNTVHEGQCYAKMDTECTFGSRRHIILPPSCVTLKTVGWRGRRSVVINTIRKPPSSESWRPVLIIANPKSGGNEGVKLMSLFRGLLNPAQVIDLSETSPEAALEFCRLFADVQCRILICGGDGTVGWVLEALDKVDLPIQPQVGIHPLGTGNDLANVLGWGAKYVGDEHEVEDILYDMDRANSVQFDRWKITIHHSSVFKKPRRRTLYMNSYVSIGCDAQVVLNFHRHREKQPSLFSSRFVNKLMYFLYGSQDVLEAQCRNLHERVQLELDGEIVQLPPLEGIVILNINSWSGGCTVWNSTNDDSFLPAKYNDGYLEVMGLYSSLHIAKLQVNLAEPIKLGQARSVKITVQRNKQLKKFPMQVDGEPWEQGPCEILVEHHRQSVMLVNDRVSS